MSLRSLFTQHPAEVGESYFAHLRVAAGIGFTMLWAGLACCLHGIFPFLCKRTGSRTITSLSHRLSTRAPG